MLMQPAHRADLSNLIADNVAALRVEALPAEAVAAVLGAVADCLGVLVAGSGEPAVAIVRRTVLGAGQRGTARLVPDGARCDARDAALVNGVAAHVLDYDDVALDGHPTAVLLPAILAEAETLGAGCGALIAAYVAGYETWAVLRATARVPLHSVGWHPSSVFGSIAAAAACAHLRGLDADRTGHALALAAAQAGGLMANFGTMAKPFQTARAAEAGLLAARLADAGMTGNRAMFDREGDFARLFAGGSSGAREIAAFGRPAWAILADPIGFKAYPVCFAAHRLIDAALALHAAGGFDPEQIEGITAYLGRVPSEVLHSHRPATSLEAKFSAEFAVASALVNGSVSLKDLGEGAWDAPRLRAVMAKVERSTTEEMGEEPPHAPFDRVVLHLSGGRTLASPDIRHATGSAGRPMGRAGARTKFIDNVAPVLGATAAAGWFDQILGAAVEDPLDRIMPPPQPGER